MDVHNISEEAPLLYSLFGTLKDPESLVLTAQDQVDFIKNIVRDEPPIPPKIMSHFDERKSYLFLEFDLRDWHFRLLLDGLNFKKENKSFSPKFSKADFNTLTTEFYEDRFSFKFVDKNLPEFAQELVQRFSTTQGNTPKKVAKMQRIFIAFAPEDEEDYLVPLVKSLYPYEQKGTVDIWHNGMIEAGEDQEAEIAEQIQQADIILLLLSTDFLASDTLYEREIQQALEQYKQGKAKVVPILARSCSWEQTDFSNLPILPDNKVPLNSKDWDSPDFAFKNVVQGLEAIWA